jgi:hypothetical protein
MNKICTSIEQSKKLMELGIDVNTADMYYEEVCNLSKAIVGNYILHNQCMEDKDYKKLSNPVLSPAWSLSALVEILSDITDYSFELIFLKRTTDGRGDVLENIYRCSVDMKDIWNTEPLDAIFEMIVWLKENKKI